MKIKIPKPWTLVREEYIVLSSSFTGAWIYVVICHIPSGTVINDMPLCFWEFEYVEIETKYDLFDVIQHCHIKERQWQVLSMYTVWSDILYNCDGNEIPEKYAEKMEETKVWFSL